MLLSVCFMCVYSRSCPTDIRSRGPVTQELLLQTVCPPVAQLSGDHWQMPVHYCRGDTEEPDSEIGSVFEVVACFIPTVISMEWVSVFCVSLLLSPNFLSYICSSRVGNCQYSHDFMRQLRFCPAACVRPLDLETIPGVTDDTPGTGLQYKKTHHHFLP